MKRIAVVVLLLLLAACQDAVPVSALDPTLGPVMERHDRYVSEDPALSPEDKHTFLRTTEILRLVLKEFRGQ